VKSLFTQYIRPVLALATLTMGTLLLSACGASVTEVANLPGPSTVTAVVNPARAVAGRIYTYQDSTASATSVTWSWGDGTPDTVGSTVQKVWNKSGSQTVTMSTTASGKATVVTQSVVVSGEPLSAGYAHSCALQPSGTVLCWGSNYQGQIGNGTTDANVSAPVAVTGLTDAVAISAGGLHTCALKAGGSVACWGENSSGQIGNGITSTAILTATSVSGLTDAVALSTGFQHTCAIKADTSVVCWGSGFGGLLGDGNPSNAPRTTPVAVIGLTNTVALSAGQYHTCALKASGSAACWGHNQSTQTQVVGLTDAVALSAGAQHTCALKANGSAACWGINSSGELGDGTTTTKTITTAVTGLTDAVAISAGGFTGAGPVYRGRSCAIKANGSVMCWGDKGYASGGNGVAQATPTAVAGLTDTAALSLGGDHTCALKTSGTVACWGNNTSAQIGDGNIGGGQTTPVAVTSLGGLLTDTTAVNAGFNYTCALKTGGMVVCLGDNQNGQLGDGTTTSRSISAVVSSLTDAVTLTTGNFHSCAIKQNGSVVCWGYNNVGQLGNGGIANQQPTPTLVIGLTDTVVQLSAGGQHTCALGTTGGVTCWGYNYNGELGNGRTATSQLTPTPVIGLTDTVVQLSAGGQHTCALGKTGGVTCWGTNNFGQIGNASTATAQVTPTPVIGLTDTVVQLSAGGGHTCALGTTGGVACWGYNYFGQLGNGSTAAAQVTPTPVIGLTGTVVQLSAGGVHTCALGTTGGVACWGYNNYGQLGNGSTANQLTPRAVTALPDSVTQLSTGAYHTCATSKTDGGVICWGWSQYGQLGNSAAINPLIKLSPATVLGGSIFWR
jgi:alpha-tubulin suppressor-like RCC1 family protein